jgi:3-oxoacyl-[acyl-carrier protein] reductase
MSPVTPSLQGKVALVTGASRGIGRAIARTLAEEGVDLALVARDAKRLDEVRAEIETLGRRAAIHAADLSDPAAPAAAVEATLAAFGRLDLLVNNAGGSRRGDFLELTEQDWADGFSLKFFGYVRMARAAWPHLAKAEGTIVNIAGLAGRSGSADFAIGGTINAGLGLLTKALADRGIADGVRVNTINPGTIETDRFAARLARHAAVHGLSRDAAYAALLEESGTRRFGSPAEVATLVACLASPRLGHLHGVIIDLDGGQNRSV